MLSELLFQSIQGELLQEFFASDMVEVEERALQEEIVYDFISEPDTLPSEFFGPWLPAYPKRKVDGALGVITSAQSAIVVDAESGMRLLGRRSSSVRPIGSVTKLMAAMVFLDAEPDLSRRVTINRDDFVGGGRVYLQFDDGIILEDVLGASVVGSDNTATQSLATHIGLTETEFVSRMNQKAKTLEMMQSTFTDPTGIRATNTSTAEDLVKLLQAAEQYPELAELMTTFEYSLVQSSGYTVTIENTNKLLNDPDVASSGSTVVAGKTGYLPQAGYVLASAVERAGIKLYIVVLGSESIDRREIDTIQFSDWAFKSFEWPN